MKSSQIMDRLKAQSDVYRAENEELQKILKDLQVKGNEVYIETIVLADEVRALQHAIVVRTMMLERIKEQKNIKE